MRSTRGAPRPTGIPALAGLLLVVFVIAGLLVYEAWSTGRSRREIAQRGLQDYAAYATWSTARAGDLAIGSALSMLFRGFVISRIPPDAPLPPLSRLVSADREIEECDCALAVPAQYFYRLDYRTREVSIAAPERAPAAAEASTGWAAAKVGSFTPPNAIKPASVADDGKWLIGAIPTERIPASVEFGILFVNERGGVRAVGYVPQRDPSGHVIGLLGFVAPAPQYAGSLFTFLWHSPRILPAALTRGIPNDSLLAASVSTPDGVEIYRTRGWERALLSDTASLATFSGRLRVRVALRRDAMAKLGGGLIPASRIPVWVGLLLLTALLTAIILRNLQREHELARLRADFTASVSHELRTPLAQILLFGETLTLGRTRSESERSRAAEIIVREARRLMQLAENALQFSRASQPGVELSTERTHLAAAVREIIASFEPLGDTRGVRITADLSDEPIAAVDRLAFRQMVINLLDNALKYGPPEQTITVGLSGGIAAPLADAAAAERRVAWIWVEDEGPGISPALRDRIWIPFIRGAGDATTGCGLGLAVVRDLVTKHEGKVWVQTASNGIGSRFVIELPLVALYHSSTTRPASVA